MEQKKHIEGLLEQSVLRKERSKKIQKAYEDYMRNGSTEDFEFVIKELDEYCIKWVQRQLWKTGCYSDENEHTAMQESRMAVWKVIEEDRKHNHVRSNFTYYAFGVYKHKVIDEIRDFSTARKRMNVVSLNEPVGDSNKTYADRIEAANVEKEVEKTEKQQLFEQLFILYCKAFTESSAYPPRNLALYYARVLPHLLYAIPDSKATSAKWAFEYMKGRSIYFLKDDSEDYLQKNVNKTLMWCKDFCEQLDCFTGDVNNAKRLGDVIYTLSFEKNKIEDWAEYMHKVSTKAAMLMILNDHELLEAAKEYISNDNTLYKLVKGGRSR